MRTDFFMHFALFLCGLFYEAICYKVCLVFFFFFFFFLCVCVFSPLSIAITSLGELRDILGAFVRLFDLRLFGFVCFLFLLVFGKGCGYISEEFRKQLNHYKRIGYKGKSNFSEQFRKLVNRYKRIGCSLDIMRQTACLVVNPIIVDGYASLFNCTTAVRASDSMNISS